MKSYFLMAILGLSFQFLNPCSSENQGRKPGTNDEVFDVEVLPAQFTDRPQIFTANGEFDYAEKIEVRAGASGLLEKVFVNVGDTVEAGSPLFTLSNTEITEQIELKRARIKEYSARLALAQTKVQNAETVEEPTTQEDVEFLDEEPADEPVENTAPANEDTPQTQKALVLVLENMIERLTREADILDKRLLELTQNSLDHGVVLEKHFSEGSDIRYQDIVLTIVKTEPLIVTFTVPENLASFITKQSPVTVAPLDDQQALGTGTVDFIAPNLDETNKTIEIHAQVANPDNLIKGGQKATVHITSNKMDRVLTLPSSAVVSEGDKNFVFIVMGEQARLVELKDLQPQDDDHVAIMANLSIDDRVIVNPPKDLKNGSFVKVAKSEPAIAPHQ